MKICAAQIRAIAGDVEANIAKHLKFIEFAATLRADLVFFPELSLTGYEPRFAKALAMDKNDSCLDVFQRCSDSHNMTIGIGLPLSLGSQVQIGMVWVVPGTPRLSYAKQRLHSDELPFFVQGVNQLVLETASQRLVPAICYESLQIAHADMAASLGADVYLASVAKPAGAMAKALQHYPAIAEKHNMYVIMADCIGPSDDFISVGQSAVWDKQGKLLAQMNAESEGMVLMDMVAGMADIHEMCPN